jgi:hypothetical protein
MTWGEQTLESMLSCCTLMVCGGPKYPAMKTLHKALGACRTASGLVPLMSRTTLLRSMGSVCVKVHTVICNKAMCKY